MFENYNFSDFLAIFFVALPILVLVICTIFEGFRSLFFYMDHQKERPKVVLHYHYKALR
jgi:hypothetical protein